MRIDDVDSDCPVCGENAAYGDCRCDGGDLQSCGVERYIEFREPGRTRARRDVEESRCSERGGVRSSFASCRDARGRVSRYETNVDKRPSDEAVLSDP